MNENETRGLLTVKYFLVYFLSLKMQFKSDSDLLKCLMSVCDAKTGSAASFGYIDTHRHKHTRPHWTTHEHTPVS